MCFKEYQWHTSWLKVVLKSVVAVVRLATYGAVEMKKVKMKTMRNSTTKATTAMDVECNADGGVSLLLRPCRAPGHDGQDVGWDDAAEKDEVCTTADHCKVLGSVQLCDCVAFKLHKSHVQSNLSFINII